MRRSRHALLYFLIFAFSCAWRTEVGGCLRCEALSKLVTRTSKMQADPLVQKAETLVSPRSSSVSTCSSIVLPRPPPAFLLSTLELISGSRETAEGVKAWQERCWNVRLTSSCLLDTSPPNLQFRACVMVKFSPQPSHFEGSPTISRPNLNLKESLNSSFDNTFPLNVLGMVVSHTPVSPDLSVSRASSAEEVERYSYSANSKRP